MTGQRWQRAAIAFLIGLGGLAGPRPAHAQVVSEASLGEGELRAFLARTARENPTLSGTSGRGTRYVVRYYTPPFGLCPGELVRTVEAQTTPSATMVSARCTGPRPAAPPSGAQVRDAVSGSRSITASLDVQPSVRSLVGLPTRVTYTGPVTARIDLGVSGVRSLTLARVVRVRVLDGERVLADLAGRSGDGWRTPAEVVFSESGSRDLRVEATWVGSYGLFTAGSDEAFQVGTLAPIVVPAGVVHPVVAAVAVVDGT